MEEHIETANETVNELEVIANKEVIPEDVTSEGNAFVAANMQNDENQNDCEG